MQSFDWDKTFQWEKLISISLFDKEINQLLQQTTFPENKICRQFFTVQRHGEATEACSQGD